MTAGEASRELVRSLRERSVEALETARHDRLLSPAAAINRAYFAVFYAASAVMASAGQSFTKHAGLRAAVHRDLVNTGRVSKECGAMYDRLFHARQTADYLATMKQTTTDADAAIAEAERVSRELLALLERA